VILAEHCPRTLSGAVLDSRPLRQIDQPLRFCRHSALGTRLALSPVRSINTFFPGDSKMKTSTQSVIGAMVAITAATLSFQTAGAASLDATPSVVVKYDEAALGTEAGASDLYRRLEAAARQVCPDDSMRDQARNAIGRQCIKETVARAVEHINSQKLAKLLIDKTHRG
jgi:UrcA family protein